jgi:hypothetical protein
MFGSNAPKILKVIEKEFLEELKVMKGELERPEVSLEYVNIADCPHAFTTNVEDVVV